MGKKSLSKNKKTVNKEKKFDPNEKYKIEAAKELGLLEKLRSHGWKMLSAQETGKIGALVKKKIKSQKTGNSII